MEMKVVLFMNSLYCSYSDKYGSSPRLKCLHVLQQLNTRTTHCMGSLSENSTKMSKRSYAIGIAVGVAICLATHAFVSIGLWSILTNTTISLFLFLLLLRPFKTIGSMVIEFYNLVKRSGLKTTESRHHFLVLLSILLFGLYSTLYFQAVRLPISCLLQEWLALGGSNMKTITSLIGEALGAIWFDGISLSTLAGDIYGIYKPLVISTLSRPMFWCCILPICLTLFVCSWIRCLYTDFNQLLWERTREDLGFGKAPLTIYRWLFARFLVWFANVDVMKPQICFVEGRLGFLPKREGPRPTILGLTQHQVDQPALADNVAHLENLMNDVIKHQFDNVNSLQPVDDDDDAVIIQTCSCLEGGLWGIRRYVDVPANKRDSFGRDDEFGGEIFHPRCDGTSLVVLHPDDIRVVLEAGWGERHLLATGKWIWRLFFHSILGIRCPVPEDAVILYAPRDEYELAILRDIVIAAVWNETGEKLYHPRGSAALPLKSMA